MLLPNWSLLAETPTLGTHIIIIILVLIQDFTLWLGYHLPDRTVYYVHSTSRVTTERRECVLTNVEGFLADCSSNDQSAMMEGSLASGREIWWRNVRTAKSGWYWVDHQVWWVGMNMNVLGIWSWKGSGKGKAKEGGAVLCEDCELFLLMMCLLMNCVLFLELDTEYKWYWSFMEAYPAHNFLPVKAKIEAMDVLTWAWTGNNSFYSPTSPTFAHFIYRESVSFPSIVPFLPQEKYQELMTPIRFFGGTSSAC